MNNINAIIIDDELPFQAALEIILKKNYPHIKIKAKAENVEEGVIAIDNHKPNLVFLDINLPDGLGFDILDKCSFKDFEIIFTTSYNDYAVRAFEVSALHYLLKPIDETKLAEAILRFQDRTYQDLFDQKIRLLKDSLHSDPLRIILQTRTKGFQIFNISDIIRCQADRGYTRVYFIDRTVLEVPKTLNSIHKSLGESSFVRVHNSNLVNLRYIKSYTLGKYAGIIMNDGEEISISQNQLAEFKEKISNYVRSV